MNIIELAREAGYPDSIIEFAPKAIERFAALIREAVVQELVAGSGEPHYWTQRMEDDRVNMVPFYYPDQLAGAVARERDRVHNHYNDLMLAVEDAIRSEPQPYDVEKAFERAAAIRGQT